jgi:DUF4097 and DUF4098 domain-containing protein YvlB
VLFRAMLLGCIVTLVTADVTDRQTFTVPLPATRALIVELTIGHLRVSGEARTDAAIDVVRTAPRADLLSRVPVTLDETAEEVRVRATQAEGGTDPALKTDLTLRVPRDAALRSLRVMEGRITISALAGVVDADIRRGPIDASDISGVMRLETGIGSVTAKSARLSPAGLIRLRAFNGDVRLTLAEKPSDARVMALALDGTIRSAIPLTMKESWGPRFGEATIGKGEPVISLDVVTGNVEISVQR